MDINGYALRDVSTGTEIARWQSVPPRLDLPSGDVVFGAADGWSNGAFEIGPVTWQVDDPAPARRMISKSLILDRLTDDQLAAAMGLMTLRQQERWRMPGHPSVYADDPDVLMLLTAIGADIQLVLSDAP